ncbi:ABC transporter substrate-binding protein [Paenibacillus popilliae]|uniref:Extracellular solute-binding protein n=1 Tax=Paenibacillus popilliae TaxID=78057 RepID=A0ABY3ALC7_PAEPP|nr:extracellular solute-binding protein [Paenibacillus sp. SDF0028]TQR42142.1 extracellular solute-binding protein [Paenibacillus sp. SDF0028]
MASKWKIGVLLLTVVALLGGCLGEKPVLDQLEEGKGKIKIVHYNEESFYNEYGNYFNIKYPDIEFEVIGYQDLYANGNENEAFDYDAELEKFIEKNKPDVLLLTDKLFEKYAQNGKLYSIEQIVGQEKFDLEGYMPGLIDMIRSKGNGTLYGLAPSFYTSVMYYNRDLFKEHNIEPPRNKMSWQEVIDLSKRFTGIGSGDNQIYGFYQSYGDVQSAVSQIVSSAALNLFDTKGEKLLINSEGWKKAIKMGTDAVRDKSIGIPSDEQRNGGMDELFYQGKAAMVMEGTWYAQQLKTRPLYDKKLKPINWDIVTAPIDPSSPDESSNVSLSEIYAVAADSPNKRAAWEFVKFVNGPEMAKAAARSNNGRVPTRKDYFKEIEGRSTEPFYLLKPKLGVSSSGFWGYSKIPGKFNEGFMPLVKESLKAIVDNKKTVDEAVAELETKGQQMLNKAYEEQKAKSKDKK